MEGRKLDVTVHSPHQNVRDLRTAFDRHIDSCAACQPSMCWQGQILWREACLEALRLFSAPAVQVAHLSQKDGA